MRLSRIEIKNFRNFSDFAVDLGPAAVVVGENGVGKSNLVRALRLVLDPSLPETERSLTLEDFWDGLKRPLGAGDMIEVSVFLDDFEDDKDAVAHLAQCLVAPKPMRAKLTYRFAPLATLKGPPTKPEDYDYVLFGGGRPEEKINAHLRQWIRLDVLPALRNAEEDLRNWRRSPLAPLLKEAGEKIDPKDLAKASKEIELARESVASLAPMKELAAQVNARVKELAGPAHDLDTKLAFAASDAGKLLRELRLYIDGGRRGVGDASLGSSNLLYLALLSLELKRLKKAGARTHTVLAIEEPEAHLHPHLQRLAFRDFFRSRRIPGVETPPEDEGQSVLVTTHSPHIASVAPLRSIVVLRASERGTEGYSGAHLGLSDEAIADLERYIDITRGEMLFAKGVILVEGEAELYVVPALARLAGYDFDALGITVCSINGTHFEPYLRLLGSSGLNVPTAVATDGDPTVAVTGTQRVAALMRDAFGQKGTDAALAAKAPSFGLFMNDSTLEDALMKQGHPNAMCRTLTKLTANGAAKTRAAEWKADPSKVDSNQLVKDVKAIGKGRFAQRLASEINGKSGPPYLLEAIKYVAERL